MIGIIKESFMITGFVGVMMLVIEYVNVVTQGAWQNRLTRRKWGQYLLASFLGATPGCLGAFAVVAMYTHRRISLGALTACMIATSGDETFVMLAMFPRAALILILILFIAGIGAGAITDRLAGQRITRKLSCADDFSIHAEELCRFFSKRQIAEQWEKCSALRGILTGGLAVFLSVIATGLIGPAKWGWIRITIMAVSTFALFVVITVPDHFLNKHLWHHVVKGHMPRIFLWTLSTLALLHLLDDQWNLTELIQRSRWIVLLIAGIVGLVPESGPHLIFVTMFANGIVPFSVLLASSIVQDGHGMLPLLAHSRRAFLAVKLINFATGIIAGGLLMLFGF